MSHILTPEETKNWQPYKLTHDGLTPMERGRQRLEKVGQWQPWQMMGRRTPIGCVSLEITQRCNLDCSYCYLSESSEALKDIPLEEVYRRIDMIYDHYGPGTDIQVSGGDPTVRKRNELVAIVRYIKTKEMRASMLTNGIKATRDMLEELCDAGLVDVAFHVDLTQERKGYTTEMSLNEVREEYIERARGLPLSVFFNTTAYPGNFHEIPDLVRFFTKHADVVRLASFQVGADTGRGTDRERVAVNPETVIGAIREGAGVNLNFDAAGLGPSGCNRYAYGLIINNKMHDFLYDSAFVQKILATSTHLAFTRTDKNKLMKDVIAYLLMNPSILLGVAGRFAKLFWKQRSDLIAARGKVNKLSFLVHNFMDAQGLDHDRCEACSFMVITPEGPMSMCVHNAKRDDYLLVPAQVKRENKLMFFNPATGQLEEKVPEKISVTLTRKNTRGRAKQGAATEGLEEAAE